MFNAVEEKEIKDLFYWENKILSYSSFNYQKFSILKILPEKIFESLLSE